MDKVMMKFEGSAVWLVPKEGRKLRHSRAKWTLIHVRASTR